MSISEDNVTNLVTDGTDHYFCCPHCSARNLVNVRTDKDGKEVLEVVRAFMADE